jgi:serine/threonine protein kinase
MKLAKQQHDPQLYHEIAILQKMNHPNIIKLHD